MGSDLAGLILINICIEMPSLLMRTLKLLQHLPATQVCSGESEQTQRQRKVKPAADPKNVSVAILAQTLDAQTRCKHIAHKPSWFMIFEC